jgi:hypothetical protein
VVPEADLDDVRQEVVRLREHIERNTRTHVETELLMADEIARLRIALQPFADIAERMRGFQGESPLWAVIDECKAAHAVLSSPILSKDKT